MWCTCIRTACVVLLGCCDTTEAAVAVAETVVVEVVVLGVVVPVAVLKTVVARSETYLSGVLFVPSSVRQLRGRVVPRGVRP